MPFQTGNPGKPKGAVNKVSQKFRQAIVDFLEKNVDKVQESFDELTPREKLAFIVDLAPYAAPKLQSIEMDHSGDINLEITFKDAE